MVYEYPTEGEVLYPLPQEPVWGGCRGSHGVQPECGDGVCEECLGDVREVRGAGEGVRISVGVGIEDLQEGEEGGVDGLECCSHV